MLRKLPLLFFPICFAFFNSTKVSAQKKDLAVIAYYAGGPSHLDKFEVEKLTHIIYCFGHLKGNELSIGRGGELLSKMVGLKKRNPALKVLVSLGGWGGCATCSDVFSTEKGRNDFAISVKNILEQYGADGIDLDWEYPVVAGYPGHKRSPEDKDNFTQLVKALRNTLPENSVVSFAAGGFHEYIDSAIAWKDVMPYVDFVNMMTYDLVNGYSKVTGHHTALYSSNPEMESTDRAVKMLLNLGVPSGKIVIGAAFYGRVWKDVPDIDHGLYQSGIFSHSENFKTFGHRLKSKGFKEYWDSVVKAPYAYNAGKRQFITYDNKQSVKIKTQYAIDHQLRGIMFWQLLSDNYHHGLLDAIYKVKKEK